jgi:hypothetical protein
VNYQIRIRGHLGPTMRRAFAGLHVQTQGRDTLLTGAVPDQAALHGLLNRVGDLGLVIVSVRRLEPE